MRRSQAVDGLEEAEILEIIDHHRLGSIETMGPVFFRNQPVGCTATIIYQMYQEEDLHVRSEDCRSSMFCDYFRYADVPFTDLHSHWMKKAAEKLAKIAGVDMEELAKEMFNAGSSMKGKTPEEICFSGFQTVYGK